MGKEQRSEGELLPRQPDFRAIMTERFRMMAPFDEQRAQYEASHFNNVGIEQIRKKGVAVVFTQQDEASQKRRFDIWLENPFLIANKRFPHVEANKRLNEYLGAIGQPEQRTGYSAYVLIDNNDAMHLLTEGTAADGVKRDIETDWQQHRWIDLIERYNFKTLIGDFHTGGFFSLEKEAGIIMDADIIGQIRENHYLRGIAQQYAMTDFQFLRLRTLAKSVWEANQAFIDIDTLARQIVKDDTT